MSGQMRRKASSGRATRHTNAADQGWPIGRPPPANRAALQAGEEAVAAPVPRTRAAGTISRSGYPLTAPTSSAPLQVCKSGRLASTVTLPEVLALQVSRAHDAARRAAREPAAHASAHRAACRQPVQQCSTPGARG